MSSTRRSTSRSIAPRACTRCRSTCASLALFGDNGAGKTTLLRILAGLLRPSRGEARIDGVPALAAGPALRRRIGFLSHRPLVWGGLTADENLRLVGRLYGLDADAPAAVPGPL